ncbi:MAG: helicase-exonuclease AddAB subunit AddA [Defluviitaleaceae bacterium]|nr:helicase-exonuclease AddAB subunit AddA [Defluviitaleaceae bacterium]
MRFTDEQNRAIGARGCDVLVSAGAGSGKTAVLVERVLRIVTGDEPVDIDRLLVVTFTEAAAQQMRERVSKELNARIKASPHDANLRKQMALMSKSSITTIHSFCLSVARRFFHKIDMDPGFRVADGAEIELLKAEILDGLFEERYQSYYDWGEKPEFVRLAQIFDHGVRDDNFRRLVLDVYEFTRACPDPGGWLAGAAEAYRGESGIEGTVWYGYFREYAGGALRAAMESMAEGLKLARHPALHRKYGEVLAADLENIEGLVAALEIGFDVFCEKLSFGFGSLVGAKNQEGSEEAKERIMEIRDEYKKSVEDLRGAAVKRPRLMVQDLADNYDNVQALSQVVLDFAKKYGETKKEKNIADFADFEHFCLQILAEDGQLTAEAAEVAAEFDEIFIDEYQDLSVIQEIILAAVSQGQNRFMVGDVKQCIYQFRMARPQIFVEKYDRYLRDDGEGKLIHLAKNFRSRGEVINSVNWLFTRLMSADVGGVEYDGNAALQFGAEFSEVLGQDFRTVLHVVEDDGADGEEDSDESEVLLELTTAETEGKAVAAHIRGLVDGKFQVREGDGTRDIRYRDIVVLLRSAVAAQVFAQELKNHDIPAFSGSDDDYFLAQEVMVILALLQIIDNPRQDIPLTCVLYSAIFRFSPDELVEVRKAAVGTDFYTALRAYDEVGEDDSLRVKVKDFLEKLALWREKAAFFTVSQLIFYLYEQTDFYNFVGILPGGKIRRANLMMLFEKAAKYEQTSYKGLFNFNKYIERLQRHDFGFAKAKIDNENEDLVRISSIHKSKGLEFPVVFVCNLGKRFNMQDVRRDFIIDFDLGMGFRAVDLESRVTSNTFARYVIGKKKAAAQVSEEMRILYVAATRAKEKLFFVGTAKGRRPCGATQGKSFLDWILWAAPEESDDLWDLRTSGKMDYQREEEKKLAVMENVFGGQVYDESELRDEVYRRLSYEYPHQAAIYAPAKMSVSEVKRLYYREFLVDSEEFGGRDEVGAAKKFAVPDFMQDGSKIDSAGRGIIVHTVLEHIDMAKSTPSDVLSVVDDLVGKKILSEDEAAVVPVDSIVRFLNSGIAARMRRADVLRREMPFATAIVPGMVNMAYEAEAGEEMLLHGVIDCVFEEDGEMVIVDYKTERIYGDVADVARQHLPQMELYQYAVERIFGIKVARRVIYFFDKDVEVEV